ncbi:hypothetical protein [Jatrophihabitans sp. GAS493]|uniref:hypothetical protein n=1 Tax=Jatrophihabitans sp. GAS493 TaxID=1907575 RepID=UPI0012FDCE8D|nr:hypothetical protein [Jatrophihabitans sp. GAS493]
MKRPLLISAFAVAAAAVAAAPAVAGLSGNPSFSHQLPVRVPAQTLAPLLVAHEGDDTASPSSSPSAAPSSAGRSAAHPPVHPSPSPDAQERHSAAPARSPELGDDRGATIEPGDDHGGAVTATTGPASTGSVTNEPGDDSRRGSSSPSGEHGRG